MVCTYILFSKSFEFNYLDLVFIDIGIRHKIAAIVFSFIVLMLAFEEIVVRRLLHRVYSSREDSKQKKFYEKLLE